MRVSDSSMGSDSDQIAKIEGGNRALIATAGEAKAVKADSEKPAEEPRHRTWISGTGSTHLSGLRDEVLRQRR
jgi:hypothetical protein